MSIHDFLSKGKSFLDILSYRPKAGKLFKVNICLYRRNPLKRGNYFKEEIYHGQINAISQDIVHEYRLNNRKYTTDFQGCFQLQKNWLLHEYLLTFHA